MTAFLRKLFGKARSSTPASTQTHRDAFLRALGEQDIFIIAAMQGDGIDPEGMTQEQLLAELERVARDLNDREAFAPFVYERDGRCRLPFFTSSDRFQAFANEYTRATNRCYPFQLLGVKGSLLAQRTAIRSPQSMSNAAAGWCARVFALDANL